MKIAASIQIHYGSEWIRWVIDSVIGQVDKVFVFYTSKPTHGHSTDLVNPDDWAMIAEAIRGIQGDLSKVDFTDITNRNFPHEGEQKSFANKLLYTQGYDTILVVDADEVWDREVLASAIDTARNSNYNIYHISMFHYFRSLFWTCEDAAMPIRIIKPLGTGAVYLPGKVHHMGYAQSSDVIKYKYSIHGHKAEWRPDYLDKVFMPWRPGMVDVHPTSGNGYWNPRRITDTELSNLQRVTDEHPFWDLGPEEVIP